MPAERDPRKLTTKENDYYLFFFSDASPLINYYPSKFKTDGEIYSCREEFIQASKAKLFQDKIAYEQIRAAIFPGQMKALGRNIQNFNAASWETFALEIPSRCQNAKFSQNESLKEYLFATNHKILMEAVPRDSLWGI